MKRIVKYVNGTLGYGIQFTLDINVNIVRYTDVDWSGSANDHKSTSGGCFYVSNKLVAQHSKMQNSIFLSIAEAEYIPVGSCCTQILWMKQMLSDYGLKQNVMTVFCYNMSAINISKNLVQYSRTKYIDDITSFVI